MRLLPLIPGRMRIHCTSADTGSLLADLEKNGIVVFRVTATDELTLEFTVRAQDWEKIRLLAKKRGDKLSVTGRSGPLWPVLSILKHPLLIFGMLFLLLFGCLLPGRILFISVEGNQTVPERRILEAAELAGLKFGSVRRDVRSEQIKNRLLDSVPELKWAGVNTYGSRAVITVREREDAEEGQETSPVRHVVADRDGVITSCTVTAGSGTCVVGQAVKKGDILISGYTDCGITILATAAKGKILAKTGRNLTVLTPGICITRSSMTEERVRYSLILGKNRINFYKGSGISCGRCDKMYLEYTLTLPGGFNLPVSVVAERIITTKLESVETADPVALLESFASEYLNGQMIAGSVIEKDETVAQSDTLWILDGNYACIEDIGREQDEQIGELHGKTNGTDRER